MRLKFAAALVGIGVLTTSTATAEQFDPRPLLADAIYALQHCAPPHVYSRFNPDLHQLILAQTQGTGGYPELRQVGNLIELEVLSEQLSPKMTTFVVMGAHQSALVEYQIGFGFPGSIDLFTFRYPLQAPQPQQLPYQLPP